jgi:RimJ/RimL family protein N-acetyltransferase
LTDGVIVLNGYTDSDIAAHLAGEDEGIARHSGPWPQASTEATVRDAATRWSHDWKAGGPTRAFAARETATGRLLGGYELRRQPDGSAHVSYWTSGGERRRGYATRALALLLQYAADRREGNSLRPGGRAEQPAGPARDQSAGCPPSLAEKAAACARRCMPSLVRSDET